ncbi:MAG: hypothetical protein ACI37Q_06810 [Candidatus Gastranaerophilaceae bacterium]
MSKQLSGFETSNMVDLSELNVFDAVKAIVMTSTKNICTAPNQKMKYKVSTPTIQTILNEFPLSNMIELV